jgi:predicted Zn finger-like uncharacterized protein
MNLSLPCPECKRILKLPISVAGKAVRCPMCAHVFTAAEPKEDAPAVTPPPVWLAPNVSDTGSQPPFPLADVPKPAPSPPRRPVVVPPNSPPQPASKPWAGRVGISAVVLIVMAVGRLLFFSHTTHHQPVNYQPPTKPAHFTLPPNFPREPVEKVP